MIVEGGTDRDVFEAFTGPFEETWASYAPTPPWAGARIAATELRQSDRGHRSQAQESAEIRCHQVAVGPALPVFWGVLPCLAVLTAFSSRSGLSCGKRAAQLGK